MAGRPRGISTSVHRPGDRCASDYGFGLFNVGMSFRPLFGCFGFFGYTTSVMPMWELYSPKNGAFAIWLFEQVLDWTYIERGCLTAWRQRRFPSLHRAHGISTAVMVVQRESERLTVLYKMCLTTGCGISD